MKIINGGNGGRCWPDGRCLRYLRFKEIKTAFNTIMEYVKEKRQQEDAEAVASMILARLHNIQQGSANLALFKQYRDDYPELMDFCISTTKKRVALEQSELALMKPLKPE